jgi:predicted metal-dependent hydrolase
VFKKTLPLIKDDQLRLDVQGFIGQETVHSQAHSGVLDHFAAQGVDLTPFRGTGLGGALDGSTAGCWSRFRS